MALKEFSADHPKAKLMARKRASILAAARETFLRVGYGSASMEAIAAAADVSIATLYRHAESKDDLFAAVITNACGPDDHEEREKFQQLLKKPLPEVLISIGLMFQQLLTEPNTIALMRAVMAETTRFPELGEMAYRSLVGRLEDMAEYVLAAKEEAASTSKAEHRKLATAFVNHLFGSDIFRVLLGMRGASQTEQRERAERAAADVLARLRIASVSR